MIDHLLKAPDEPTLIAAIGSYKNLHHVANPADGTLAGWRSDICICPTVTDNTDPNNPVVLTDFHLWVALPAPRGSPAGVEAEVHTRAVLRGGPFRLPAGQPWPPIAPFESAASGVRPSAKRHQ